MLTSMTSSLSSAWYSILPIIFSTCSLLSSLAYDDFAAASMRDLHRSGSPRPLWAETGMLFILGISTDHWDWRRLRSFWVHLSAFVRTGIMGILFARANCTIILSTSCGSSLQSSRMATATRFSHSSIYFSIRLPQSSLSVFERLA